MARPKNHHPAEYRYYFRLNATENADYLELFERSQQGSHSAFIRKRIFNGSFKVIQVDPTLNDYKAKVDEIFYQFRGVAVNYNQIVRLLKSSFSEKKALAFLYKLEKATNELVNLNKDLLKLTNALNEHIQSEDKTILNTDM